MANITVIQQDGTTKTVATASVGGAEYPKHVINDGTNQVTVQPASTTPAATDIGLTVSLSPNLPSGTSSITVQGAGASGATTVGNPVLTGGKFLTAGQTITNGQTGSVQMDANSNIKVVSNQVNPPGVGVGNAQTQITASSTGGAQANNCTLTGQSGKTMFITGFTVTGAGATSASVITVTVTGTITGTLNYTLVIPSGATTTVTPLHVGFPTPVAASAVNTSIVVNVPSFGSGNTNASASAYGFYQ